MVHLCTSEDADSHRSLPAKSACGSVREFLRDLDCLSERVDLTADRVLCREGDKPERLFLLKRGDAVFTVCTDDQVLPCFAVHADSLIGLSAVIAHTPYALTATVSPGAEVHRIDAKVFLDLVERRADHFLCVLRILAEETLRAHQALAEMLAS
jgi:CRP-like cAMP-binding protein